MRGLVALSYAPVSQHPDFDSWTYARWAGVAARVVDGISYRESASANAGAQVEYAGALRAQALRLPVGDNTASLEH